MGGGDAGGDGGDLGALGDRSGAGVTGGPGSRRRLRSRRGGGLRGPRAGGHPREDLADRDGLAGLGEDLGDRAARGRGHLGVDLVRGDLDDRLVDLDAVADGLGPLEDRALGDRLAHLRHHDVERLGLGLRLGGGRLLGGRLVCCRGGPRAVGGRDLGEDGADVDGVALGEVDLHDGSGGRGGDLGVDLVGRDLDERLVLGDRVALLLVPLQDGAVGDRLTHRRHGHFHRRVDRHVSLRPYRVPARLPACVRGVRGRRIRRCPRTGRGRR